MPASEPSYFISDLGDYLSALFYGLATTTAFARTRDNKHWTSDVVGGALLGIYTADFVDEQHRKRHNNGIAYAPYVDAETVGIQVRW